MNPSGQKIFTGKKPIPGNVKTEEEATEIIQIALSNYMLILKKLVKQKAKEHRLLLRLAQDYCRKLQENPINCQM